jgi:hypothetical protein
VDALPSKRDKKSGADFSFLSLTSLINLSFKCLSASSERSDFWPDRMSDIACFCKLPEDLGLDGCRCNLGLLGLSSKVKEGLVCYSITEAECEGERYFSPRIKGRFGVPVSLAAIN